MANKKKSNVVKKGTTKKVLNEFDNTKKKTTKKTASKKNTSTKKNNGAWRKACRRFDFRKSALDGRTDSKASPAAWHYRFVACRIF